MGRAFTSGTKISTGLELARDVLRRDRVEGGVVLVSDLQDDQNDVGSLTETLISFRREGCRCGSSGLAGAAGQAALRGAAAAGAVGLAAQPGRSGSGAGLEERSGAPVPLIAVALLALLALAANELFNGRLAWRPT